MARPIIYLLYVIYYTLYITHYIIHLFISFALESGATDYLFTLYYPDYIILDVTLNESTIFFTTAKKRLRTFMTLTSVDVASQQQIKIKCVESNRKRSVPSQISIGIVPTIPVYQYTRYTWYTWYTWYTRYTI